MHKRPLSLKKSGGVEASSLLEQDAHSEVSEAEGAGYTSSSEEESDSAATPAPRPDSTATSKDIPKGFARIERDATGKILRVVMSAHDVNSEEVPASSNATKNAKGKGRQTIDDEDDDAEVEGQATPWGAPLNDAEEERLFEAEPESIETDNPALRGASLPFSHFALSQLTYPIARRP